MSLSLGRLLGARPGCVPSPAPAGGGSGRTWATADAGQRPNVRQSRSPLAFAVAFCLSVAAGLPSRRCLGSEFPDPSFRPATVRQLGPGTRSVRAVPVFPTRSPSTIRQAARLDAGPEVVASWRFQVDFEGASSVVLVLRTRPITSRQGAVSGDAARAPRIGSSPEDREGRPHLAASWRVAWTSPRGGEGRGVMDLSTPREVRLPAVARTADGSLTVEVELGVRALGFHPAGVRDLRVELEAVSFVPSSELAPSSSVQPAGQRTDPRPGAVPPLPAPTSPPRAEGARSWWRPASRWRTWSIASGGGKT